MTNVQAGESALKVLAVGAMLVTASAFFKFAEDMPESAKREMLRRLFPNISKDEENEAIRGLGNVADDIRNPRPAETTENNS
ncbi:hypothetical protein ACKI1K_43450 [Streptomyces scabiei]|uniref:hypothetical protein n=1 Tax=Streptomyces scabiei TaxID=1930 RepID=UPI0038F6719A